MSLKFYAALPAIYDAATNDDHWPKALDAVVDAVGARGAILMAFDLVGLPFQVQKWCTTYKDEDIQFYFQNYAHFEESGFALLRANPPRTFHRDSDVWNYDEIGNREDVEFLRSRYGIERRGAATLNKDRGWSDSLALQIDRDWSSVAPQFWQTLDMALPHIAKVVEVNRTFTLLRRRYEAALAALDHLRIGICIGLEGGHILVANQEAQSTMALSGCISLGLDGKLRARDEAITAQIREAIDLTARTAGGSGNSGEIAVVCPRPPRAPLLVEACPLRDARAELERGLQASLIAIIDPERTADVSIDGLQKLFNLSEAETQVCEELLRGRAASEVADIRNVSPETVRTQVKTIYAKTGVSNRVELIRLAIAANPPIC